MSISILNRGASGGLKPELTVTAPAGSTIDLLQGGIVVDTYTLGASETEHTFVVKVGTYTARITLGEETNSKEVLIDNVGQYAITINYRLYLYHEGNECTDITGGWSVTATSGYSDRASLTKNAKNMLFHVDNANYYGCTFSQKAIDFTKHSTLYMSGNFAFGSSYEGTVAYGTVLSSAKPTSTTVGSLYSTGRTIKHINCQNETMSLIEHDVHDVADSYYLCLLGNRGVIDFTIENIWLE